MKFLGKTVVISGASQGLGYEVAKQFIIEGAHVVLCARNLDILKQAQISLTNYAKSTTQKILAKQTDVSKQNEVSELIQFTLDQTTSIDILVANAGIYGPKGPLEEVSWDEWSKAIDINLKGTVLQCHEVLPIFKQKKSGKIIILSGGGATKPMPYLSAYAASKAAVVRFGESLAMEVESFNIGVNMVAPGALNTRLLNEVLEAGEEKVGKQTYQQALKQKESGGNSLEAAAALCLFLASEESNGINGKLISAVWDTWKNLPNYLEELKKSDIYTIRRITPEDRNLAWSEA